MSQEARSNPFIYSLGHEQVILVADAVSWHEFRPLTFSTCPPAESDAWTKCLIAAAGQLRLFAPWMPGTLEGDTVRGRVPAIHANIMALTANVRVTSAAWE